MGDLDRRAEGLEAELRDLSAWLETPDPPDVTAGVRARLVRGVRRRRRWRSYAAAALVALLVAVLPPTRAAIADALGEVLRFAGVSIATSPTPSLPAGEPSPLPSQRTVGLDEARRAVRFPIRMPSALGPPERATVAAPDGTGTHRVATLLYDGGALRLDAFDGRLDLTFHKQTSRPGAEWTEVNGSFAIWVDGPHVVSYVDRSGQVRKETARLAASTLIWEQSDVTYRLEGSLTRAEALKIARSLP
ncbi:hypothetical protein [Micromonospora lupini]|uniref:DUF4367 domain-containing protein n=1 Tax=Micromonospora lupini str. Lupac 08 TaxID=1150864 RepID=I0L564_9ACTN|nr:hypothetical protein [Micromonospora lupini]CCH18961.1 Conserved hypothetical protein [Micromonospora lupini str. Lupac 08]